MFIFAQSPSPSNPSWPSDLPKWVWHPPFLWPCFLYTLCTLLVTCFEFSCLNLHLNRQTSAVLLLMMHCWALQRPASRYSNYLINEPVNRISKTKPVGGKELEACSLFEYWLLRFMWIQSTTEWSESTAWWLSAVMSISKSFSCLICMVLGKLERKLFLQLG